MRHDAPAPVALVTGGRRGIGLGIAKALAADGFDIAITDIAEPQRGRLAELGAAAKRSAPRRSICRPISPTSAGHQATVDAVMAQFGRIDCLVNNAGMASVVRGDFLDLTPENFDTIVATNLRGTVFFTQAVVKAMLGRRRTVPRSIINITSVSADDELRRSGSTTASPRPASPPSRKGWRCGWPSTGIAVFEVRPGIIRSDMTAGVSAKYDALIDGGWCR